MGRDDGELAAPIDAGAGDGIEFALVRGDGSYFCLENRCFRRGDV